MAAGVSVTGLVSSRVRADPSLPRLPFPSYLQLLRAAVGLPCLPLRLLGVELLGGGGTRTRRGRASIGVGGNRVHVRVSNWKRTAKEKKKGHN